MKLKNISLQTYLHIVDDYFDNFKSKSILDDYEWVPYLIANLYKNIDSEKDLDKFINEFGYHLAHSYIDEYLSRMEHLRNEDI